MSPRVLSRKGLHAPQPKRVAPDPCDVTPRALSFSEPLAPLRVRSTKAELRTLADWAAQEHPITVCEPYYGYDAMGRKRGRPRKPKLKLVRSVGRPRLGEEMLTAAEKQRRYRDRRRNLRLVAGVTRVHFTPRLQAWMSANLKEETLLLCNMRRAA